MSDSKWKLPSLEHVEIENPKLTPGKNGKKSAWWGHVKHKKTGDNLRMSFDWCYTPFGADLYDKTQLSATDKRDLTLRIESDELKEYLTALEVKLTDHIARFSEEIWGTKRSGKFLREAMIAHPILKQGKGGYDPQVRLKLSPAFTDVMIAKNRTTFRKGKSLYGTIDDIRPKVHVRCNVELSYVWFIRQQFGCTLKARTVIVLPNDEEDDAWNNVGEFDFDMKMCDEDDEAEADEESGQARKRPADVAHDPVVKKQRS